MALQVSDTDLGRDLSKILDTPAAKLASFYIHTHQRSAIALALSPYTTNVGGVTVDLTAEFYIDQLQAVVSNEDVFSRLEENIGDLCTECGGAFIERQVEPYRTDSPMRILYKVRLGDYDNFLELTHKMALKRIDKEFTAALEEKLSEG